MRSPRDHASPQDHAEEEQAHDDERSTLERLRIVLVTLPALGHLNPLAYVGAELSRRGHIVFLASCAFIEPKVRKKLDSLGIRFVACAGGAELQAEWDEHFAEDRCLTAYHSSLMAMKQDIVQKVRPLKPDAIVTDFFTPIGASLGDACGVPVAVNFADPVFLRRAGPSPGATFPLRQATAGMIGMGLPRSECPAMFRLNEFICTSIYTRRCIVNSFLGMEPPTSWPPTVTFTGVPAARPDASPLSATSDGAINTWLDEARAEGRRILYVAFGSQLEAADWQLRALYEGLSALPNVAVAWSLRPTQQAKLPVPVAQLPRFFLVKEWYPQAEMLRLEEVAVFVTHCGWNSVNESLAVAKPMLGVPFYGDQPTNAARLQELRVAERVPAPRLSASALTNALRKMLDGYESYAEAARKLQAALLASGGGPQCADVVEELAAGGIEGLDVITRAAPQPSRLLAAFAPKQAYSVC